MLHVLNDIYSAIDAKRAVTLVGLDISAAFDTISHELLLRRLDTDFGVRSVAACWLRSYLSDRRQFVKIGRHSSASSTCTSGVPQGSVLGPLLFSTYVTPIGSVIKSHGVNYHQFADDTQLYVAIDTSCSSAALGRLAASSDALRRWFLENDLMLNGDKSEAVFFGTTAQLKSVESVNTVSIAGSVLPVSRTIRSLGVSLDCHLRFDTHARAVAKACTHHTLALRHVRHMLSREVATTIACSIVASRLDFCNSLMYGAPAMTLDKLQRVQNTLARVVTLNSRRASSNPLLQSLHWLPIRERIRFKVATLTYKVRTASTPVYLHSLLNPSTIPRHLRSSNAPRFTVPRTRTELCRRAFSVAAPVVWNSLRDSVVNSDSYNDFRKQLKTFLFTRAYLANSF